MYTTLQIVLALFLNANEENDESIQEDEFFKAAAELVQMVRANGLDPKTILSKGQETISFGSYEDLVGHLNDYVGENGKYTPLIKAVRLLLNNELFQGLSIVDTPGLNDPILSRTLRTKEFMEECDVVFFLSQSGSFLDANDWELLSAQLPQKGVKKLILIASKYDSSLEDLLKKVEEDDPFADECDSDSAHTIPEACEKVKNTLTRHAKRMVEKYQTELRKTERFPALIQTLESCKQPLFVSAMTCNMVGRPVEDYTAEEKSLYNRLKEYSSNIEEDLETIGDISKVRSAFEEVSHQKDEILAETAKNFIPTAKNEVLVKLESFGDHCQARLKLLRQSDYAALEESKKLLGRQSQNVKCAVRDIFTEVEDKIREAENNKTREKFRTTARECMAVNEHSGTESRTGTRERGFWIFKWDESYSYTASYKYVLASDAISTIGQYTMAAAQDIENIFSETVSVDKIRKKMLKVILENFDLSDERLDTALFRNKIAEAVNRISFPTVMISSGKIVEQLATEFSGEIRSSTDRERFQNALTKTVEQMANYLLSELSKQTTAFMVQLEGIQNGFSESLLKDIRREIEDLQQKMLNKKEEIQNCENYARELQEQVQLLE